MKITPLDIQQQQFKGKVFGGLDPEEVDTFLQLVSREMEDLVRENAQLREQEKKQAADMEEFAQREKSLRETMLAAQRITEEMKANAQKEATLVISEAQVKAEKIVAEAERRLAQLQAEIQDMRRQKLQFETSFRSLLDSYLRQLAHEE